MHLLLFKEIILFESGLFTTKSRSKNLPNSTVVKLLSVCRLGSRKCSPDSFSGDVLSFLRTCSRPERPNDRIGCFRFLGALTLAFCGGWDRRGGIVKSSTANVGGSKPHCILSQQPPNPPFFHFSFKISHHSNSPHPL